MSRCHCLLDRDLCPGPVKLMKYVKLKPEAAEFLDERSGVVDMAQRLPYGLFFSQ